ncbi:MAG: hypothetical protein LBG98_00635 [Puniceicoccales bacterium]|jgi:hypothetical protein|nr:hypothetical protein [Puniceicoccales bacterium]
MRIVGVFCTSCSSLLARIEEGERQSVPEATDIQPVFRENNNALNDERMGEEIAPEAIADPLRLISRGIDNVRCLLDWSKDGYLYFMERSIAGLMRNERFDLPLARRFFLEDTWDHCLIDFATMREFLAECMEKLDAMAALAQAVRDIANGRPDHTAEARQNYERLCEAYRQQRLDSSQQRRELGMSSWVQNNL